MSGPTVKQAKAIAYLARNPNATVWRICTEAGVSNRFDNQAAFIQRLIDNGWIKLALTDAGRLYATGSTDVKEVNG